MAPAVLFSLYYQLTDSNTIYVSKITANILRQFQHNFLLLQVHPKSQIELAYIPRESRNISSHRYGITAIPIPEQVSSLCRIRRSLDDQTCMHLPLQL